MADKKLIAKNTLFLYFRMLLVMVVSLYTSRVTLRTLGIVDYGINGVVGGIVAMFGFLNGSLSGATSRYITFSLGKKDYNETNRVFNVALVSHVLIALIIVFLAETIGLWFFYNKMVIPVERIPAAMFVYQVSIITTFISLLEVPYNATIIANERMSIYAYIGIAQVLIKLIVAFAITISPFDKLMSLSFLSLLSSIGFVAFNIYYCRKNFSTCDIKICRDKKLYREIFGYSGADLIGNISVLAQGQGLNLLLNVFFGPTVNAARTIAYQVQGAITQFGNNFMTAVRPQIIKTYAEGKIDEMMVLVKQSSTFSFYLLWMIAFPVCLEAEYILKLWLGEYPEYTISFLILIIVLCLIQALKTPRSMVYHALGKLKFVNLVVGSILCAAFPLAYVFLKLGYDPNSVFWAANISMVISELASILVLKKYIDYSIGKYLLQVHGRCLLVCIVSFIIPYFVYQHTMEPSFLRLIITCLLTTTSVGITVYTIGMDKPMRKKLLKLILSIIKR